MDQASVKAQLLAELDQEWANVERICYGLGETEMSAPSTQEQWSVKDTLAHISAWEKLLLDRLGYAMTGLHPQYPPMSSWDDVHRFNAQVYAENKERPLNSIIIEFRNLYQGVMTVLEALNEDLLEQPYTYDFADDHITLLQFIRANTIEHYREHCVALKKGQ